MNALIVGTNKTSIVEYATNGHFLFIDDGPLLDVLSTAPRKKVVRFDVSKHHLNPLHKMDYAKAREFVSVVDSIFPEGDNTLTKKNSNFVLLEVLLDEPTYLI